MAAKKWRTQNPIGAQFAKMRHRDKVRGVDFSLTIAKARKLYQQPCVYCGDPTPSLNLDRVDSSRGYSNDNVVPCCLRCNKMKSDMTTQEFIERCRRIAQEFPR